MIEIRPLNFLSVHLDKLIKGRLWLKVIVGLITGIGLGIVLNPGTGVISASQAYAIAGWLNLPGQIFMNLVKMVMIPLVITSITAGIVSNSAQNLKSFGVKLLVYFLFTTTVSISIGVFVALVLKPGKMIFDLGGFPGAESREIISANQPIMFENIPETISNLIPDNPLESILMGEMLGVVIFTIIIGVAILQLRDSIVGPIIKFTEAIQKICMVIVSWAMRIVPYAVFGLMAALVSKTGLDIFLGLGIYIGTVLIGLFFLFIFYLLLIQLFSNHKPIHFLRSIVEPILLAFSTASSAAVMPLSMKTADEKLGVSSKVSDFVIPVGATVNMDGTALFQCVTTIFMAQSYGIELSLINIVFITATVVAASVGTPAIPGGGVIILTTVLESAGIPVDGLIVIIGIDRILGMFRTSVNVTGDLTASVIFDRLIATKRTV